jgi:hypothetical protein
MEDRGIDLTARPPFAAWEPNAEALPQILQNGLMGLFI